jgi:hypothetical protein
MPHGLRGTHATLAAAAFRNASMSSRDNMLVVRAFARKK